MRLFRSDPPGDGPPPVPELLRALERGDFVRASEALKACGPGDPLPPPHALWRLGRSWIEHGNGRRAIPPLELMIASYPNHGDTPAARRDLARALLAAGKRRRAARLVREIEAAEAAG